MSTGLTKAALRELQNPAPVGQRHTQIVRLACWLRRAGWSASEVFYRLRANYDPATLPDAEISAVIQWAEGKRVVRGLMPPNRRFPGYLSPKGRLENNPKCLTGDCLEVINPFLKGFSFDESELFDASPIKLPEDFREDASLTFETLYLPSEKLNLVTRFRQLTPAKPEKTQPSGFGQTLSRNEWLNWFREKPFPESLAGAWLRINPVNGNGVSDGDISEFRFALLESDLIPVELQISLFAKLPIPICAIVKSGGKSIHAWVRIGATNAEEYREKVSKLFSLVSPFGFDTSNRNPSRLSRLPGAQRIIGAHGDGEQRLLYLNPNATERNIA